MNIGKLNKQVELHSLTETKNGVGEPVPSYSSYGIVWAKIEPLRGDEKESSDQVVAKVMHKITVRYNASIVETDRIVYDSRIFEINSILDLFEKKRYLEIMCTEVK